MDSHVFGEYITKEYGLLRQIISYLEPRDLHNAKLVCKAWHKAVESIVEKNPLVLVLDNKNQSTSILPKPITPELVIYTKVYLRRRNDKERPRMELTCQICGLDPIFCPCRVNGPDTVFLSLTCLREFLIDPASKHCYSFVHSPLAFLLSSSDKVKISTYYTKSKSKKKLRSEEVLEAICGAEPIKCIIPISTSLNPRSPKLVKEVLNHIVLRQGFTFAVGGGLVQSMYYKTGSHKCKSNTSGITFITLSGENVSAQSQILHGRNSEVIEQDLIQLKERVGDVPEGGTRIAFIAQCVDRIDSVLDDLEKRESDLFKKHFPSVPQIGFHAWGEYGACQGRVTDEIEQTSRAKRMKINFFHSYTTSIVILTFKKV